MKKILFIIVTIGFLNTINGQKQFSATLNSTTKVSKEGEGGLYFAGTKNVNYRFSQRISPHGDCIDVVNGFAFVTWYKGGMDQRNLMLSRKNLNVADSPWVTIEFPHKHVGQSGEILKGTGIRGDSHNTAAIGISTIDNTIHIIYDMHAYNKTSLPNDFFNYSVSKKNMAFVSDAEFTLDIFNTKRNYLKSGQDYERMTYPMIHRADDGSLVARYRKGGSGNGDILLAHYNGTSWSNNWLFHEGTLPLPNRNNMYGGERFLNGKFYSGFSIRYANNNNDNPTNGYAYNSGLYFAYTNQVPKSQSSQWFNANNQAITLPIRNNIDKNSDPVKIGEPGDDFGTATNPRTTSDPAWTVTKNGAIHFITRVDNQNVHYYRAAGTSEFSKNKGGLIPNPQVRGEIYSYQGFVFMVEIISGKVVVKVTPEGKNDWSTVYSGTETIRFNHFDAFVENDKLYVYLMQDTRNNTVGEGDKRPLYFQEFTLAVNDKSNTIGVEAEDFTTASSGIVVTDNAAASGGKYIGEFRTNEFLEYNFQINADKAGVYDFNLIASNRNRDDSTMDININGMIYFGVNITRTFDWDIFKASTIPNITLNEGENTIRITQKRSLSSRPDKIELVLKSTLNTDVFSKEAIAIYPNPSSGIFRIKTSFKNITYQLVNIQGSVLEKGKVEENQIDFSKYNSGIYFLRLNSANKTTFIKKILVK
ncbi:BNR-4 repeat-containing protein [Polaribacter aquimarinus]|uniref:CBM6 domain-containing protein n=1 Tax=Polaribacter aquimarinus TaxID=2100726 RepID=A0A2U2JEH4_9FLAO|nr:BNR-4 repeat-containing protein [Polaribacter aquimarinus]PWG06747.1 hypothetical protein DIS07_02605 [Polaribacter aquimarinus]